MSKQYLDCQLRLAVSSVRQNRLTFTQASVEYNVPRTTVRRHARNTDLSTTRGPARLLSEEEENGLVNYLIYMSNQGFPLSRNMVRCYLQELLKESERAKKLGLKETGPSDKWFRNFNERHPELSERMPENQDKARTRMSNGPIIERFFEFFQSTMEKLGLEDKPDQIFNCDETGWSNREKSKQKVYGVKKGHVFRQKVFSADHITAHLCISAGGRTLSPMVIFKGGFPHRNFNDGIPDNWLFGKSDTGYMDSELFAEWFEKSFIPNCGRSRPVVLLMDNHDSHISKCVVDAAIKNDIILIGLPSHTTHILQPLDVHFIGPLKEKLSNLAVNIGYGNQQVVISKAKFPVLLSQALDQISASTVKEAFRRAGIYPINKMAIDRSQLVEPMFSTDSGVINDKDGSCDRLDTCTQDLNTQETCSACGQFLRGNPLVTRGLIPASMAAIFLPPPSKPEKEKTAKRRVITEGRVISTEEMLKYLTEKEENERKKKEAQELRQRERELKKEKRLMEEDSTKRKQKKKQKRNDGVTEERQSTSGSAILVEDFTDNSDSEDEESTVCCVCGERQPAEFRMNEYINFLHWGKCNFCSHWTHLKYCSPVKAIRRETVFRCPHCTD